MSMSTYMYEHIVNILHIDQKIFITMDILIIILANLYFYPKLILIFSILSQNNIQHSYSIYT